MLGYGSLSRPLVIVPEWRRVAPFVGPPVLALAVLVAVWVFVPVAAPSPGVGAAPPAVVAPEPGLMVDVSGAVVHPGIYRVDRGERAYAAIAAAGGLAADADRNRMPNLAAVLKDGQQVRVPPVGGGSGGSAAAARVSLNFGSAEQLAGVPGFTPDLVQAVLQYRTEYGGFGSTRELTTVLGMTPAEYALAKSHVTL